MRPRAGHNFPLEEGLGKKGILDVKLPKPIPGGTIYGHYGEWFLFSLLSGTVLCLAWRRKKACVGPA
jgi:hypothetical protein